MAESVGETGCREAAEARSEARSMARPQPERSTADTPDPVEEERWKIYKRTGEWDDVIEGPDTDEKIVVPASLAAFLADDRDRYANRVKELEALPGGSGEVPAPWFYCETEGARTDVRCTDDCGCRVAGEVPAGLSEVDFRALEVAVWIATGEQGDDASPVEEQMMKDAIVRLRAALRDQEEEG